MEIDEDGDASEDLSRLIEKVSTGEIGLTLLVVPTCSEQQYIRQRWLGEVHDDLG